MPLPDPLVRDPQVQRNFDALRKAQEKITYQTVASGASITVLGDVATITGTTNITSIAARTPSRITLIFEDVLTVTDGSNLNLNGNFTTTAGDTLTLVSDGTDWFETGRSVN